MPGSQLPRRGGCIRGRRAALARRLGTPSMTRLPGRDRPLVGWVWAAATNPLLPLDPRRRKAGPDCEQTVAVIGHEVATTDKAVIQMP
jgi:hypothetical protein